ncbi:probable inactive purple acid phosphatase 16 [Dioscorea cayenensis subsp. rotundata]|uniref:Probable inactive purple acid phosphatase 16 n=1 Tax=Dioscorea cayennensis subsp. rotundata TaxID=55577 RepID=A0AB40CAI2_DIOCR|nr:probable inactive purple acid phosphatase 16 [Dioscorea cayenensis subsp. rotundata]
MVKLFGYLFIITSFFSFALCLGGEESVLRQPNEKAPLRFSADSTFKITLFADLHYGEAAWLDWGPEQDRNSSRVLSAVLDSEIPDFVIYLGDVITANNLPVPNASMYWDQAISPTRNRGIPWATLFGNHDDAQFEWPPEWFSASGIPQVSCPPADFSFSGEECYFGGTPRVELMKMEIEKNKLSYSASGPKELWPSVSNYILRVLSAKDGASPVVFLYFLDSGGGSYPEVISRAQVDWFNHKSKAINPDESVPEVIFWHIPSTAYEKIAPRPRSAIQRPCVGSLNEESVAPQEAEWGIIDIFTKRSSAKALFVGHNHGLDWCCPYEKLWLCFARHSGYGGYGTWPRGARIIEMTEHPFSLKSWIRMEDNTVHSEVTLSS